MFVLKGISQFNLKRDTFLQIRNSTLLTEIPLKLKETSRTTIQLGQKVLQSWIASLILHRRRLKDSAAIMIQKNWNRYRAIRYCHSLIQVKEVQRMDLPCTLEKTQKEEETKTSWNYLSIN